MTSARDAEINIIIPERQSRNADESRNDNQSLSPVQNLHANGSLKTVQEHTEKHVMMMETMCLLRPEAS